MKLEEGLGPTKIFEIDQMLSHLEKMEELLAPQISKADRLQDEIVESFLKEAVDKEGKAHLFLIVGLPGAGKSTVIADALVKRHDAVLLDADLIKEKIPLFGRGEGAGLVHELSSTITSSIFKLLLEENLNIVFPIIGRNEEALLNRIHLAIVKNYQVHLIYVHVPIGVAIQRVYQRWKATGRFVSPRYVLDLGDSTLKTFSSVVSGNHSKLSSYLMYDNDVDDRHPRAMDPTKVYS